MPIHWDAIEKALDRAADQTDEAIDSKISSLTRMTDAEVQELFPSLDEKRRMAKLMSIVKSAATENEKKDRLAENIQTLGGAVIKLLARFV